MEGPALIRTAVEDHHDGETTKSDSSAAISLPSSHWHASPPNSRFDFPPSVAPSQSSPVDLPFIPKNELDVNDDSKANAIRTISHGEIDGTQHGGIDRKPPIRLFDLPMDILHLIVKEITHTNDLCSLALTHSALHKLAIAQIYSRFDIVWPDNSNQVESRTGVDALTYGLATLVMSEDVFGEALSQHLNNIYPPKCSKCGHCNNPEGRMLNPMGSRPKKRRGNYYAEFTRKFSLGNGPEDWIKEYLANTESGKMLGTLVALAIARMHNLETFIWDMPTGILLDVWNALSSLGDREKKRLEKVWIRWHNNSLLVDGKYTAMPPVHTPHTFWLPYSRMTGHANLDKRNKVERPTFSMLSPLKSLNVLDIDECLYLDEMSILISESLHCLRELRVGIAAHAVSSQWAYPSQEDNLSQTAQGKSRFTGNISLLEKRLGGVLGILTGYFFDLKNHTRTSQIQPAQAGKAMTPAKVPNSQAIPQQNSSQGITLEANGGYVTSPLGDTTNGVSPGSARDASQRIRDNFEDSTTSTQPKLRLETLGLERVSLSIPVLSEAFDWTCVREITLLDCQFTASFWAFLRRRFTPTPTPEGERRPAERSRFALNISKIHTNTVTPILLAFMKDTLAPDSLEVLFLAQSQYHLSTKVSNHDILRVIKRHRGSLRKILIDSSERDDTDNGSPLAEGYERWIFDRKMIFWITSGKMPRLRELGMAMYQKDWHYFLQRLPFMSQIRALYLPYIAKTGTSYVPGEDAREFVLQVLDILTLRPDVELCYLAIANKCFEIMESRVRVSDLQLEDNLRPDLLSLGVTNAVEDDDAEEEEEDEEEDDAEDQEDDEEGDSSDDSGTDDVSFTSDEEAENDANDDAKFRAKMDVREILFYDDKVAIFKAMHGRL